MASARMKRKLRNEAPVTVTVVHGHIRSGGKRHGPDSVLPLPTWQAEGLVKQGLVRFGATASLTKNSSEESGQPPAGNGGPSAANTEGAQGDDGGKPPAPKKPVRKKAAPKKKAAKKKTTTKRKVAAKVTAGAKVTG